MQSSPSEVEVRLFGRTGSLSTTGRLTKQLLRTMQMWVWCQCGCTEARDLLKNAYHFGSRQGRGNKQTRDREVNLLRLIPSLPRQTAPSCGPVNERPTFSRTGEEKITLRWKTLKDYRKEIEQKKPNDGPLRYVPLCYVPLCCVCTVMYHYCLSSLWKCPTYEPSRKLMMMIRRIRRIFWISSRFAKRSHNWIAFCRQREVAIEWKNL